jgi:PAS domain S-box-containing protein
VQRGGIEAFSWFVKTSNYGIHRQERTYSFIALEIWEDLTLEFVSDNVSKILGYSAQEFTSGRIKWLNLIHPEDIPKLKGVIADSLSRGMEEWELEYRLLTKSGLERWIQEWDRVIREPKGNITHIQALVLDISERKQDEYLILRKSKLLSAINRLFIESLTCEKEEEVARLCLEIAEKITGSKFGFINTLNPEGLVDTIALSNPAWQECTIPPSAGIKLLKNMPVRSYWGRVLKEGISQIVNEPDLDPDRVGVPEGHPPITSFLGVPLFQGARVFGSIGLANKPSGYTEADREDIETLAIAFGEALDRKQAELRITSLNEELKEHIARQDAAYKELESFSYTVSHDLRAPLRAMDGFSRMLLEEYAGSLDAEGLRLVNIIHESALKLGKLIDDLLSFTQLGRQEISLLPINMYDLALSVVNELKPALAQRKVEFKINPLPRAKGDKALIHQVLKNLVSNALKFTRTVDNAVIEIGGEERDSGNIYYIKDNGIGFNMKYAEKIFGVFQRLHTDQEYEGTGVGLSIVQRIIQRHKGEVWAESKAGEGATFYFTLPGVKPDE